MDKRILNIDEIASIKNKHWKQLDEQYRKEHPDEDIPMESEPSDEESDLCFVKIGSTCAISNLKSSIIYKIFIFNCISQFIIIFIIIRNLGWFAKVIISPYIAQSFNLTRYRWS